VPPLAPARISAGLAGRRAASGLLTVSAMRVLVVDDSPPRRRLLASLLTAAGHETLAAANGAAALELLETEAVEAVVSDVKMPRMDGFQLCHALRCDARWARLPFIFYSSVFIGNRAQELGMDLGATAYLDAKRVPPEKVGQEIDRLVGRIVSAEYREALVRLHDDLEFARRYHAVVLSSLGTAPGGVRDTISSNVDALDEILSRLDSERRALATRTDVMVPVEELNRLRELSDYLGDKINTPLGVLLGGTTRAGSEASGEASDAAASVRATVRRLNELVRKISRRDRAPRERAADG
jgi:CheY-like chemotaxis protein